MIISIDQIIQIGIFRKHNKCAWCKKDMDMKNYNIQLCRSCRLKSMEKVLKEDNKGDWQNALKYENLKIKEDQDDE